jgi:anti-sigma regulatory factor (Ser/Thr protein kinase)
MRISLPRTAASPAEARLQVSRFVAENDLLGQAGVALLVLSELVTNAVLHGSEPIQVCVTSRDDILRIEVSDGDTHTGRIAPQGRRSPDQPGGRGLQIVNSLARSWGTTRTVNGKTVWAEVGPDEEPAD